MKKSFKELLEINRHMYEREGLFYQKDVPLNSSFEHDYIQLREREGRLYTDDTLSRLPEISDTHPHCKEWMFRRWSLKRLVNLIKKMKHGKILEVGCGNGWLINSIQQQTGHDCCGVDVNETELLQAVRVFSNPQKPLHFVYGDITSDLFEEPIADVVVIASALQYFENVQVILNKLLALTNVGGVILIIDTPFYHQQNLGAAKLRSDNYFSDNGHPEMKFNYFHHSLESLREFDYKTRHDPHYVFNKIFRKFNYNSPFPWVVITK